MPLWLPGGWAENLKIVENGQKVSYLVGKSYQTTKFNDFDPSQGKNLGETAYFDSISPLNGPADPLVGELKIWKLLKMVERCPI